LASVRTQQVSTRVHNNGRRPEFPPRSPLPADSTCITNRLTATTTSPARECPAGAAPARGADRLDRDEAGEREEGPGDDPQVPAVPRLPDIRGHRAENCQATAAAEATFTRSRFTSEQSADRGAGPRRAGPVVGAGPAAGADGPGFFFPSRLSSLRPRPGPQPLLVSLEPCGLRGLPSGPFPAAGVSVCREGAKDGQPSRGDHPRARQERGPP